MVAIRDIAVIGAGPSGLSAAKYLLAEKVFKVQLFEQKSTVGGVWAYNTLTIADDDFSVPRTKPSEKADNPIFTGSETEAPQFVSPVYDSLETNIPHTLMNFTDQPFPAGTSLFPGHAVVKRYLDTYAEELQHLIKFSSQILSAAKSSGQDGGWELEVLDLKTKEVTKTHYDAIVVASGHYNDPFIPDIPGLKHFNEAHPTAVSHSKFYKSPTSFANKKVIVVGNSASGLDISDQISKVTGLPVIVSERSTVTTPTNAAIIYKPEIAEFVPEGRKVRFADGDVEEDIDHIVFCTGYFYSFPFLKGLSPPVITDGSAANNLYQHMLYAPDPTLCFLGIPQRVVPFPFVEAQVGYLARVWAGRVPLPTDAELEDWQSEMTKAGQEGQGNIHSLKFPKDLNYINMLHSRSMTAEKREGLANGGMGKLPPYWNEEKAWTRERFPLIKAAARKLGDARHAIVDLRQLGFDFEAEKPLQDPQDKLEEGLSRLQMSVAPSIAIA